MKKFLSSLFIIFMGIVLVGCGDNSTKLQVQEFNGGISNFYNYALSSFETSYSNNRQGVLSSTNAGSAVNHMDTIKSGYIGGVYNFANFIPVVDYITNNKTGTELYAYNFNNVLSIYSVTKQANPQTISGLRYTLFSVSLTSGNNTVTYAVKVNRQKEVINVITDKVKDFEVLKDENQKNIQQKFQIAYEKDKSYLQVRNITSTNMVVSYEMCFDANNNLIYRRNVGGIIEFDAKLKTNVTGFEFMILSAKNINDKFEFTKFNEDKFNFKNFANQTNLDVLTANMIFNSEKIEENTYEEFIASISIGNNVPVAVKDAYENSLISGEN